MTSRLMPLRPGGTAGAPSAGAGAGEAATRGGWGEAGGGTVAPSCGATGRSTRPMNSPSASSMSEAARCEASALSALLALPFMPLALTGVFATGALSRSLTRVSSGSGALLG